MIGIEFNQQQLEARKNGATMFIVPIEFDYVTDDYNIKYAFSATMNELDAAMPKGLTDCENYGMSHGCDGDCPTFRKGECSIMEENKHLLIEEYSPLNTGDEFFIKEDLTWCKDCKELLYDYNYYEDQECTKCGNDFITDKGFQEASQMQEHQARYKDVCLNVEVKRVQDMELEWYEINPSMSTPHIGHDWNNRKDWLESQENNYKDNPSVFLITMKGINK